jgi:hypothetical protein
MIQKKEKSFIYAMNNTAGFRGMFKQKGQLSLPLCSKVQNASQNMSKM